MKKQFLDLSIYEFVRVICRELNDHFLQSMEANRSDYNMLITAFEVYDYLDCKTKGFDIDRCKILLEELEHCYSSIKSERDEWDEWEKRQWEEWCEEIEKEYEDYYEQRDEWDEWEKRQWEEWIKEWDEEQKKVREEKRKSYCEKPYENTDILYYRAINYLKRKIGQTATELQLEAENPFSEEKAKKYLLRAIELGYVEQNGNNFKWKYGGNKGQIRLGYFCSRIFPHPRPESQLEKMFGVKKLSSSMTNAEIKAVRSDVKEWRSNIDKNIFYD